MDKDIIIVIVCISCAYALSVFDLSYAREKIEQKIAENCTRLLHNIIINNQDILNTNDLVQQLRIQISNLQYELKHNRTENEQNDIESRV